MKAKRPSPWVHVADIASETEPGLKYAIKRHTGTGLIGCGCPSWIFSRGVKTCKHVESLTGVFTAAAGRIADRVVEQRVEARGERFIVTGRRGISLGGVPLGR